MILVRTVISSLVC